ncbi:MAG: 2Fe-2S iron-sulfur cluster binding domain-containing protein [Saprospiraceae bacterium]|nr:2Fe-2S iron-sulfur cluster binding domain-containing protein [Saprospiraceae bacterium]MBK8298718.1 2Fe-2S iron-sulfur cluster binding domain-containing protein [Saprospiraceae bacterium]
MKHVHAVTSALLLVTILFAAAFTAFTQTADEHAKHHPVKTSPDASAVMTNMANSKDSNSAMSNTTLDKKSAGMGGMMDGMGDMMKEMGKAPTKEIYPSLMQLPDFGPEKRDEIKQLADKLVSEGNALLTIGLKQLSDATRDQNYEAMEDATQQIHRGQTMLESGLEGQRALAENKDPRIIALQWFKKETDLSHSEIVQPHGFFGLSWFHYITMFTFAAFAIIMIWMYFHKMKRANELFQKLAGNTSEKTKPPGNSKPDEEERSVSTTESTGKPEPNTLNSDFAPSKPNSWTGTLLVAKIFDETQTVKTFRLTDPAGGNIPFNYLPGQFITVTVVPKGVPVKRSYTIASSPTHRDYCEITVKHEEKGTVSHYMHTYVHEGELMQFTAPSGKFTFTEKHADSAVFIAGGVGVTPMMSAIRYLTDRSWKGDIFLFFSCKNENSIIFREEIGYLQKRYPNFHVVFVLSQPEGESADGFISGHITKEILNERVPDIISRMIHICGPPPMITAVKLMLDELKVPKENVMVEVFAGPATPGLKTSSTSPAEAGKPDLDKEAGKSSATDEAGKTGVVTFAKSNKTAILTIDKSILEASEEVGVNIDYSCRIGTCGICKTKLISGKVTMAIEDSLTEEDKAQNIILACQAKATEDVSVDA